MENREVAKNYYELNARALAYRNSYEYFIGDRINRYVKKIKGLHLISFMKLFCEDIYRVLYKKKKNPDVEELDFTVPYIGKRIAVYTSVYGKYDKIYEPLYKDQNCDYYIYTDQNINQNSIWKKVNFDLFPENVNTNFLKNRYIKMLPQKFFPNYEYSVYIDGNLQITSEISLYFRNFSAITGIAMHKHPSNTGIYEEIMYNCRLGKITETEATLLKKRYKENKMPDNFGMYECNVICRKHHDERCKEIMERWWTEIIDGVKRDQLYFTYVIFLLGYKFEDVGLLGNNINSNPMFIRYQHK